MSASAVKVAPKTLHQFRNFSYVLIAWLGFNKGYREKRDNDAAWMEHQKFVRQQNVERYQAANALREAENKANTVKTIPEIVPEDLHEVYKEMSKSIE